MAKFTKIDFYSFFCLKSSFLSTSSVTTYPGRGIFLKSKERKYVSFLALWKKLVYCVFRENRLKNKWQLRSIMYVTKLFAVTFWWPFFSPPTLKIYMWMKKNCVLCGQNWKILNGNFFLVSEWIIQKNKFIPRGVIRLGKENLKNLRKKFNKLNRKLNTIDSVGDLYWSFWE